MLCVVTLPWSGCAVGSWCPHAVYWCTVPVRTHAAVLMRYMCVPRVCAGLLAGVTESAWDCRIGFAIKRFASSCCAGLARWGYCSDMPSQLSSCRSPVCVSTVSQQSHASSYVRRLYRVLLVVRVHVGCSRGCSRVMNTTLSPCLCINRVTTLIHFQAQALTGQGKEAGNSK